MDMSKKDLTRYVCLLLLPVLAVLFPQKGMSETRPESRSWTLLEKEVVQLLKRFSPEEAFSPSDPIKKRVDFYLDAGLWSTAEEALLNMSEEETGRLLMKLYARQRRFGLVYASYRKDRSLFIGEPFLSTAAAWGGFEQGHYSEIIPLLESIPLSGRFAPSRHYLTALVMLQLHKKERFEKEMEEWIRWGDQHPGSPWIARAHLIQGYYHLSQKSYDLAFASLGRVFNENVDTNLAMIGIGWSYFEIGSSENLMSILEGLEEGGQESRYGSLLFEALIRSRISEGDFRGAIEANAWAYESLRKRIELLQSKQDQVRRGEIPPLSASPPGSLLKKTLLKLERQVGEQQEISSLLRRIDLAQRQGTLFFLRKEEQAARKMEEKLASDLARRCMLYGSGVVAAKGRRHDPLYSRARAAARAGKVEETEAFLKRLLKTDPTGPYAEEATFRLGEIAFERGKYDAAISYYRPLAERPKSYLYRNALYKTAWSRLQLGNPEKVLPILFQLKAFLKPVDGQPDSGESDSPSSTEQTPCHGKKNSEEREEYHRLLALALEMKGGPATLIDWLRETPLVESFPIFSSLAEYYEHSGRKREASQLIAVWIAAYPRYVETPFLHRVMIDLHRTEIPTPEEIQTRISFVENYRPGTRWAEENGPEGTDRVKPVLKEQLLFLTATFHDEAKKGGRAALYQKVIPWYERYLTLFPDDEETGPVRFHYAEALAELKEEPRAAEHYRKSAYNDPPHSLASEAAYREILISEKTGVPPDRLWESYGRFIQNFPSDLRVSQVYLKQAEIALQEKDYEKSRRFAETVVTDERGRDCEKGGEDRKRCLLWLAAQRLIVQGYLNEKRYSEAIQHLSALLAKVFEAEIAIPEKETTALVSLLTFSYYQLGEALKQEGRPGDAADAFMAGYRSNEKNELAPLALFEAASLLETAGEKEDARETFAAFSKQYPQSPLYPSSLLRLASLYEETGGLKEAAKIYEKAGELRGEFRGELSNDAGFPAQALGRAIALYEKMEDWEKVSLLALQSVERAGGNRERRIEGIVRGAEAKLKLGQEKVAQKMLTDLLESTPRQTARRKPVSPEKEAASFYLAKAHLLVAGIENKRYREINLVAPLEKNLQKKKNLFDLLLGHYNEVVNAPSPGLVLEATHQMGEVFEEFSRALLQSERPPGLSEEERAAYDRLLVEQAFPYLQKAGETYRQAIDWAKQSGVENEWVDKSREHFQQIHEQIESSREEEVVY